MYKTAHIIRVGSPKCLKELEALECPQTTKGALEEINSELECDFDYLSITGNWRFIPLIEDNIYAVLMETNVLLHQDEWDRILMSLDIVAELLCSIEYNGRHEKYVMKTDIMI